MTAPSEDAVGVAREKAKFIGFVERAGFMDPNQFPDEMKALDALIAAVESRVRAECAAELRVAQSATQSEREGLWELADEKCALWEAP